MSSLAPGLSDLSQSIFASLGLEGVRNSLGIAPQRRVALLLVDGLGADSVGHFRERHPIFTRMQPFATLTSHLPSTTVTNLTSFGTGEQPGVHGMLGYTVRIPESGVPGELMNPLKWSETVDPLKWQSYQTLFERADAAGFSVSHISDKRYNGTGFTRASLRGANFLGAQNASEMVDQMKIALAEPRSFAYLYTNILDSAGHQFGVRSPEWLNALEQVAALLTSLCAQLPRNSTLYLTADHGMLNAGEKIVLGEGNNLMHGVSLVGGEPRMRHIYLENRDEQFAEQSALVWRDTLGSRADVFTKQEAMNSGIFGDVVNAESARRIGDLVVIAHGSLVLLNPARVALENQIVGQHGGQTSIEREIPLLGFIS